MKNHLLLVFIFFTITAYSQTPSKKEVYKIIIESKRTSPLDTNVCDNYYTAAVKDINRKNLDYITSTYLDFYNYYEDTLAEYYFNDTEWLWLEENTPFTNNRKWYEEDSLISSDVLPIEVSCYDVVFFHFKNSTYGKNYSSEVIRKSDSLKMINMGYLPIKLKQKKPIKFIQKKSSFPINFTKYNETLTDSKSALRADVLVNSTGKIMDITCWYTHNMQGPYKKSIDPDNAYVIEVNHILREMKGFYPAKYNGKNIDGSISIYFPFIEK